MNPGDMRWTVTILRRASGSNAWGEDAGEWRDVRTVRATKIHKSEDEKIAAAQRYEVRTVTFRMWFTADLFVTDRLRCDGLEFEITGLRELGFREGLEVAATYSA